MTIDLGPFRLLRPIGKGGMGVVWHGTHIDTDMPVAVKVITQRVSRDERTLKAFKNEVRAVAGLDHPGIVWVVDYGEVDQAASQASQRQLTVGSPYLVMEIATGGTLASFKEGLRWSDLKRTLLGLLDALAHAHARGVIHRDLKPGNVLVCTNKDLRPGLKLTDFGIAHAREETVSDSMSNHVIGTLHYMAPEQIRADWRDYGPWTDLYALGSIAYRLATGHLPFKGKRGASLMVAQMNHRPPALRAIYPVSEGFEDWLLTMMRKEHWRRFQCAADAALSLASLADPPEPTGEAPRGLPVSTRPGSALVLEDHPTTLVLAEPFTAKMTGDLNEITAALVAPPLQDAADPELARRRGELDRLRPCIPEDWRRPTSAGPTRTLRGAGLGLWGLRDVPLVGREAERDVIWKALLEVNDTRKSRAIIVRGPSGTGKSRIVKWIAERAVEIGAGHFLRCSYSPDEEPQEGLRRMLRRFFRVARLDAEMRRQRVLDVCDSFGETDVAQAERVEKLLDPVEGAAEGGGRHAAARWLFGRMAADRPLVLWFDDAHYGVDALKLVGAMLKSTGPGSRVLVLLTVSDERLSSRPVEAAFLKALAELESVSTLPIGPLSTEGMHALVDRLIGLDPSLATQVVERAKGSPQFAIQLVGDWVEKGILEHHPEGYRLPEGRAVPGTMGEVWGDRIEQVVADLPSLARQMLERAAVLGFEVDDEEWRLACDDPEGELHGTRSVPLRRDRARWRATLVDRLLTNKLAEERDFGFAFAQEELRATLIADAKRADRLFEHHRAVAGMLSRQPDPHPERLGMHLLAAGDLDTAIDALMRAVQSRSTSVGPRAALSLLDFTERALSDAVLPVSDVRYGQVWLKRAQIAVQRGRMDEGIRWAQRVSDGAVKHEWGGLRALAVFVQATVALFRRDTETATSLFGRFERVAGQGAHDLHRAAARYALSILAELGNQAQLALTQAVATSEWLVRADATMADVWRLLGSRALLATHRDVVMVNLERRRDAYETPAGLTGLAECWMMLARTTRKAGDIDGAERALQHADRLYTAAGSTEADRPRVQMALLKLTRSDFAGAEQLALGVARDVRGGRRKPVLLRAHALLAACAAGSQAWTAYADNLSEVKRLLGETGATEREVAWALARAGDLARKGKHSEHAVHAWRLALDQYQKLGDAGQVRRLTALLQSVKRG